MTTYRLGIAQIDHEVLGQMLHLPAEHRVKDVRAGERAGYFEVLLEGPTLPETDECMVTPYVNLTMRVELGEPVPERKITTTIEAR